MIRISLGRVGSGKTLMEVREMTLPPNNKIKTYSNIRTKLKHQVDLKAEHIMKKVVIGHKKNGEEIFKVVVNLNYWKKQPKPLNIVIDEAHTIVNSRRAMSKTNVCVTDWLALIRRVIGSSDARVGTLTFITQLPGRLDPIIRAMANKVSYHICRWIVTCPKCKYRRWDSSEAIEPWLNCPYCETDLKKYGHYITTYHFKDLDDYYVWDETGARTYYKVDYTYNVSDYFDLYDTLQWENLILSI